jgi:hypothetical protein
MSIYKILSGKYNTNKYEENNRRYLDKLLKYFKGVPSAVNNYGQTAYDNAQAQERQKER